MKLLSWMIYSFVISILALGTSENLHAYQEKLTPREAFQRLKEGNARFVKGGKLCPNRTEDRRAVTASVQKPFAIVLGCSDSRVPPELAFDQGIGDIFVVRVAGNVVGATELDSVEYSALVNDSSIVLVLGHGNCGAVQAVLANNTKDIQSVADLIKPAMKEGNKDLDTAILANIQHSVKLVKESEPIRNLMNQGKLAVIGGFYDLKSGQVKFLEEVN